jgi:hypothetical protein
MLPGVELKTMKVKRGKGLLESCYQEQPYFVLKIQKERWKKGAIEKKSKTGV